MKTQSDDGYGRNWEYRVVSQLNSCPDDPIEQRRLLTLRRVFWMSRPRFSPVPGEIEAIEAEDAAPEAHSIAELEVELERMRRALDKPALILAEWHVIEGPWEAPRERAGTT